MDQEELLSRIKNKEDKIKEFGDILDSIESTGGKKKMLWKEIYENSVSDRENAYILFHEAYSNMMKSAAEHITVGPILIKYLERMNKANDQLIKLSELISKAEEHAATLDQEDIFSQIKES
jgi:hypothetical protein